MEFPKHWEKDEYFNAHVLNAFCLPKYLTMKQWKAIARTFSINIQRSVYKLSFLFNCHSRCRQISEDAAKIFIM